MSVTEFAAIIGAAFSSRPYTSQNTSPAVIRENIPREISLVCFVLYTFRACGIKAAVVQKAAT